MRRLSVRAALAALAALAVLALTRSAFSLENEPPPSTPGLDLGSGTSQSELGLRGLYLHTFGGLGLGRGLRFNNPYRLRTSLGSDAESLSLTATYADLSLGAALGDPRGLQHGAVLHLSMATDGVSQEVLSASYVALYPLGSRWLLLGRAGVPVVLEPDLNAGAELGAGGAFLITAAMGVGAELIGSLFYGAATLERSASVIPLLSFQAGVWLDYEVLP